MFVYGDEVYALTWYWPWKTFICQDGLCCCNMALISFRLFRKNLGNLRDFFGQMVYRPSWQKISRTPMFKHLPQDKFSCLFVILFNAYLSFLLLRQLRLFVCYVFSVVSFFCFAIIAPFSCHMLLISTPLALLSFVSIVPFAVSSSLLFLYIIFLFLCHFC